MACPAPPLSDSVDITALKAKYEEERRKRLRVEGENQYAEVSGELADFYEVDPQSSPIHRDPISQDIDVAILGGGFGGLLAGARLREAGINDFRIIEMGGDFGGTWYWNRYPGVQCDIESYCYLPLLEELNYIPKEKYSYGQEIYEHCKRIGRHYELYENAVFDTIIRALRWDETIKRWRIDTNREDDIRARFLVMASGPYNRPKLPRIAGIQDFKGPSFHTCRWEYEHTGGDTTGGLTKLRDKRVAIIGTGATGIQCIPFLARDAKHLYIFQRTPSAVGPRGNRPTDPNWAGSLRPGWQRERQANHNSAVLEYLPPGVEDLVCDGWSDMNRHLAEQFAALNRGELTIEQFGELAELYDFRKMEALRKRIDSIVEDKSTGSALKPWYMFWCKRPTFNDEYLSVFNRDNVTLVDVSASKGVERITENGIVANGIEYPVDLIVYASGFEVTTSIQRRLGISAIEGRAGVSLYEHWKEGFKTLHGFMTRGFPNQFFTGFTQTGVSQNLTAMLDGQARHIAYTIKEALARKVFCLEPSEEAENAWGKTIRDTSISKSDYLMHCTPGVYNNEGGSVRRSHLGDAYGPGINAFHELLEQWRAKGDLDGLELDTTAPSA